MIQLEVPVLSISILIPLFSSFIFLFLGRYLKNKYLSLICFILLLIPVLTVFSIILNYGLEETITEPSIFYHPEIGTISMYLDNLNLLYFFGVGLVTPLVALYSHKYMINRIETMKKQGGRVPSLGKFYFSYSVFSASMLGFLLSANLFFLHVLFVVSLVSSFFIIFTYGYKNRYRVSFIYLIWGALGYYLFLLGALAVGSFETFDILALQERNLGHIHLLFPLLIFTGLLIKKGLFGAHVWLPIAHSESPAPLSALLSANLIGISGYPMIRIVLDIFPDQFARMSPFFLSLAFITMIYGGLNALAQDDLKRLLAYASVSQMGWVVFGISTMTTQGVFGGVILFIKHSLSLSVLFMGSGIIMYKYDGLRDISDMGDLWRMNPVLSGLMIIAFLTLVGLPLTVGFWGKALIFSGAINMEIVTNFPIFLAVVLGIVFAGGVTAAYSFITIKRMFLGRFTSKHEPESIGWSSLTIPMGIIAFIGIILFFLPGLLFGPVDMPDINILTIEGMMFLTAYVGTYAIFSGRFRYHLVLFSHRVEEDIIDEFFHNKIPTIIKEKGNILKRHHRGQLHNYLLWLIIGIVSFLVFMFLI